MFIFSVGGNLWSALRKGSALYNAMYERSLRSQTCSCRAQSVIRICPGSSRRTKIWYVDTCCIVHICSTLLHPSYIYRFKSTLLSHVHRGKQKRRIFYRFQELKRNAAVLITLEKDVLYVLRGVRGICSRWFREPNLDESAAAGEMIPALVLWLH